MGKHFTRRDFLKKSLLFSTAACCSAAWGPRRSGIAYAQALGGTKRTALFFNQFGGADHLNSWAVPYTLGAYFDRRPTIAHNPSLVLPMKNGVGLHPILTNIHTLYNQGDVAVIQGIGDPVGNRSHFTSQQFYSQGVIDPITAGGDTRGWIGRLGDLYFKDTPFNTFGLEVGNQVDFVSNRTVNRPLVSSNLSSFGFTTDGKVSSMENLQRQELLKFLLNNEKVTDTSREASVRSSQNAFAEATDVVKQVIDNYSSAVVYPDTSVGSFFNDGAKLIKSNLVRTQVIYGGKGGWDTHASEAPTLQSGLQAIDQAIGSFASDLKQSGHWNNAVICIFTEFGRNTFENASGGTDHGWGGAMVLIGGAVKGGVYGSSPTTKEFNSRSWVYMDIDFRNVFANIIKWLGYNPAPVFPEPYTKVNIDLI